MLEPAVQPPARMEGDSRETGGDGDGLVVRELSASPNPRVLVADAFLSTDESAALRALFDSRHSHTHSLAPLVCFARGSPFSSLVELLQRKAEKQAEEQAAEAERTLLAAVEKTRVEGEEGLSHAELHALQAATTPSSAVVFVSDSSGPKGVNPERVCFDTEAMEGSDLSNQGELAWSTSTFVYAGEDDLVDAVQERLEQVFGLPRTHALATQLLKYEPGQSYDAHTDCNLSLQVGGATHVLCPCAG